LKIKNTNSSYDLNGCPHGEQDLANVSVLVAPHCVQVGFAAT